MDDEENNLGEMRSSLGDTPTRLSCPSCPASTAWIWPELWQKKSPAELCGGHFSTGSKDLVSWCHFMCPPWTAAAVLHIVHLVDRWILVLLYFDLGEFASSDNSPCVSNEPRHLSCTLWTSLWFGAACFDVILLFISGGLVRPIHHKFGSCSLLRDYPSQTRLCKKPCRL